MTWTGRIKMGKKTIETVGDLEGAEQALAAGCVIAEHVFKTAPLHAIYMTTSHHETDCGRDTLATTVRSWLLRTVVNQLGPGAEWCARCSAWRIPVGAMTHVRHSSGARRLGEHEDVKVRALPYDEGPCAGCGQPMLSARAALRLGDGNGQL